MKIKESFLKIQSALKMIVPEADLPTFEIDPSSNHLNIISSIDEYCQSLPEVSFSGFHNLNFELVLDHLTTVFE
jgi:hypothetical protein